MTLDNCSLFDFLSSIWKVPSPIGRLHFHIIPVPKQIWPHHPTWYISWAGEVCSEVPEDSRVLRVRCLWFPTSDRLQTWLIASGTTRSRHLHESTLVWRNLLPYNRFLYFVLSFSSKRGWQSGSKHYQRWYEGRLPQSIVDSLCYLDRIVPERISQVSRRSEVVNHKRRNVLRWAVLSNGYLMHFLALCLQ